MLTDYLNSFTERLSSKSSP